LVLLDWEKAFGRINHEEMWEALAEIGIPSEILRAMQGIYANPEFRVKEEGVASEWFRQETGIRQGCPQSPYLFIVVTSVMFQRIKIRDSARTLRDTPDVANFQEVLYADDTILISTKAGSMNKYLALVEQESGRLGLKLNRKKCKTVCRTRRSHVKFQDGEVVKKSESAEYLGVLLNTKAAIEEELETRIRKAAITWKKLKPYWRRSVASKRTKLLMYNALIRSKIIYGLESAELKQSGLQKLNTFQLKGLRQILRLVTTFIDRENSNTKVLQTAEEDLNRNRTTPA